MITLLLTLVSLTFSLEIDASLPCQRVEGNYNIADGRGRFVEDLTAQITQTEDCRLVLEFGSERHTASIMGRSLRSDDGEFTGELDMEGRILWSNGWYYWPEDLPSRVLPVDCLHPFSLHCHESCSDCIPCAHGSDDAMCEDCGRCEMCLDYLPCAEAIQHMPECTEPEAFDCLRECRECADCAEFDDCLEVESQVDSMCLTTDAAFCLDNCEVAFPCLLGEETECEKMEECRFCQPFIPCVEQVQGFPLDKQKCVSSKAIHCYNDCSQCSSCADKMYCLDAFTIIQTTTTELQTGSCSVCVAEFAASGGCECWADDSCDEMRIVPEGCDHCAKDASEHCGIPLGSDTWIQIWDYPCRTHGQGEETLNQVYISQGFGANGREIFRGSEYPQWWIYFDDDCGGDQTHPSAWYVTVQQPSFDAMSNLGMRQGGCTNTMKIQGELVPTMFEIDNYMCDDEPQPWNNSHMRNGMKVKVEFGVKDMIHVPCDDDNDTFKALVNGMTDPDMVSRPEFPFWVAQVNEQGCEALHSFMHDAHFVHEWCMRTNWMCKCTCDHIPPMCFDDHDRFKAIMNRLVANSEDPAMMHFVAAVNEHGCGVLHDDRTKRDWCHQIDGACGCMCDHLPVCFDDHERFKAIMNRFGESNQDPGLFRFVAAVNEHGCGVMYDEITKRDWCDRIEGACCSACEHRPPTGPEEQHCARDEDCLYMGCEDSPVCDMRGDHGVCMMQGLNCPKKPGIPRPAPELCTSHSDCHYSSCAMPEFTLPGHCSGVEDTHRDCSKGDCVCVHGNVDERCANRPNGFDVADGGWCFDGRRDAHCPVNHDRTDCLRIRNGNYQINDKNDGHLIGHMTMSQFADTCQGEAKVVDQTYLSLEVFRNAIRATTTEGEVHTGFPSTTNGLEGFDWNGDAVSFPIDCMMVWTGSYTLIGVEGHVGRHSLQQDGCNGVRHDQDGREHRFQLHEDSISIVIDDQHLTGVLIEDTQSIRWSNGYESHPIWEEKNPECREDGHAFAAYVRSRVPNMDNPRIRDFLTEVEFAGCEVLRRDHDAKYDWCTFHPEARDACSCVCEEVTRPKPVCSKDQFKEWLRRDLGEACTDLFISGLAEEHHHSHCDCLRGIPEGEAMDLFGSECYFTNWSDRSFLQMWRNCQGN